MGETSAGENFGTPKILVLCVQLQEWLSQVRGCAGPVAQQGPYAPRGGGVCNSVLDPNPRGVGGGGPEGGGGSKNSLHLGGHF